MHLVDRAAACPLISRHRFCLLVCLLSKRSEGMEKLKESQGVNGRHIAVPTAQSRSQCCCWRQNAGRLTSARSISPSLGVLLEQILKPSGGKDALLS